MVLSIGPSKNSKFFFKSKMFSSAFYKVAEMRVMSWGSWSFGMWCCVVGWRMFIMYHLILGNKGIMFLQNFGNHSPTDAVAHLRRLELAVTPVWKHQTLHRMCSWSYHTDSGTTAPCFCSWVHFAVTALLMWFCLFLTNCVVKCKLWQYLKTYVVDVTLVSQHMKDRQLY